jgi:hypothetical protein
VPVSIPRQIFHAHKATTATKRMRILLICHRGALLDEHGMSRWLASFSDLVGLIVLNETRGRFFKRVRRELRRVGIHRFWDVLLYRIYHRLFLRGGDQKWETAKLNNLRSCFPDLPPDLPVLRTHSPNVQEAERFIRDLSPDIIVARCKTLLKENIFSLARTGTFVMHPGICPEYRNAHGCFWALAEGDTGRVGMTLLRIDRGVDTGPVYRYFSAPYDERNESHYVIQQRMVFDNLEQIRGALFEIYSGQMSPLDVSGRKSAVWGQPWFTRYLKWKYQAWKRSRERNESNLDSIS